MTVKDQMLWWCNFETRPKSECSQNDLISVRASTTNNRLKIDNGKNSDDFKFDCCTRNWQIDVLDNQKFIQTDHVTIVIVGDSTRRTLYHTFQYLVQALKHHDTRKHSVIVEFGQTIQETEDHIPVLDDITHDLMDKAFQ